MKRIYNQQRQKGRFIVHLPKNKLKTEVIRVTKKERQLLLLMRLSQNEN